VNGQVIRHSSSYRQGLVLGLTMAEVMILLIFCLLIALAAYLRLEHAKVAAAEATPAEHGVSTNDRNVLAAVKGNPGLYEKLRVISASADSRAVDEFWRDLVATQSEADGYRRLGLTVEQVGEKIAIADSLQAKGIDVGIALRDVEVVRIIRSVLPASEGQPASTQTILEIIQRGLKAETTTGHQWPPIISLSEAEGYYFRTGSAELSPEFRLVLLTKTPERIVELIKQYDVDVIEVVGHTDEQPISVRPSNLDNLLLPVLRNEATVASLVPADNAGLGLARAISVIKVLRESKLLDGYKLIPLSGAQLVNTDETLAITGMPGDIRERRRIEIRLRKSSVHDASVTPPIVPIPRRPRPVPPAPAKPPKPTPVPSPNDLLWWLR
jgi:flagellar motor protein MotB